jgi:hypothetical protein
MSLNKTAPYDRLFKHFGIDESVEWFRYTTLLNPGLDVTGIGSIPQRCSVGSNVEFDKQSIGVNLPDTRFGIAAIRGRHYRSHSVLNEASVS